MATKKKETASKATENKGTKKSVETPDDWFASGEEGMARKRQQDAMGAARKERGVGRFFMKEREKALITFVGTDGGFAY